MNSTAAQLAAPGGQRSFSWVDAVIFVGLLGLLWSFVRFGHGMIVHFNPDQQQLTIDTNPALIPYYSGRTLLRMWIAFGLSLLFTFVVGYVAAKSRVARALILPALDFMQSVPVLAFLSATVTGFMALFPGSLFGVECASIFAIFTGQVWNMTFGFYHSMVTIPQDLREAATNFRLSRVQRFRTLELPASMHSLIWNSMMSFGGGWFFVTQSEAITVLNKNISLPGLGSYVGAAIDQGNYTNVGWALLAMLIVILASDQLVWRPLLAWADKFKIEMTESAERPTSWFYSLLRRAYIFEWLDDKVLTPLAESYLRLARHHADPDEVERTRMQSEKVGAWIWKSVGIIVAVVLTYYVVVGMIAAIQNVQNHISVRELSNVTVKGLLTLARVLAITIFSTIVWTPIGVWIGLRPKAAKVAQPLALLAASFPVNMTFPITVGLFVRYHIPIGLGSVALMAMGTQWYVLFNVIAGAMAIPNDLKEAATTYGLKGWPLWRTLIIPAIFPFWVTGACTAAGGAWNVSIVAEVQHWGDTVLQARGLGAFITEVSNKGDTAALIIGIAVMSFFVLLINKLVWRRLYSYAERRFHLD
ncbi:MAG: ABC transporter permease subunit [Verrucomicrobia bacterium]|nr:ABC transporter permease subunit [Verrucomicrobiota bacterium]